MRSRDEAIQRAPPARLESAWGELRAGRWEKAASLFEQAVKAEETPEAFEGLSWAAWWLDDAEAVFAARERAFHLDDAAGDAADAARMATWLASDQLDFHGAFAVAAGWLAHAHRLLDPLESGPEHRRLAFLEGYMAHAGDETAKPGELGAARPSSGGSSAFPIWRCSGSPSRGRRWWRALA